MTANPKPRKRNRRQKYSAAPIAVVPPEADLGPAMLALTPMQHRFVMEFSRGPTAGYGGAIRACKAAGYAGTENSLKVTAHQVLHNPKVQDALREVGGKIIRASAFELIRTVAEIARDLSHKDCLKANLALLDRGGFAVETVHHVTVEHVDRNKETLEQLQVLLQLDVPRDRLVELYGADGLFHLERELAKRLLAPQIEAEYTVEP